MTRKLLIAGAIACLSIQGCSNKQYSAGLVCDEFGTEQYLSHHDGDKYLVRQRPVCVEWRSVCRNNTSELEVPSSNCAVQS